MKEQLQNYPQGNCPHESFSERHSLVCCRGQYLLNFGKAISVQGQQFADYTAAYIYCNPSAWTMQQCTGSALQNTSLNKVETTVWTYRMLIFSTNNVYAVTIILQFVVPFDSKKKQYFFFREKMKFLIILSTFSTSYLNGQF